MSVEQNMELMQTLDDAWNNQDWETFNQRHAGETAVYWPGQPEPTRGRHNHRAEAIEFFKTFPDNHIDNRPYQVKGPDGKEFPPTNQSFEVEFCTVAHWKDGEIVEEKLFYDLVGLMEQMGVM